jgi:hypothetical protein
VIGPAPILAAVVALFHVSAYTFIRGTAGNRLALLLGAAFLGAWAGDALGARLGIDPILIGDFHVISASVLAWIAIGLVSVLAVLGPERPASGARPANGEPATRGTPAARPPG